MLVVNTPLAASRVVDQQLGPCGPHVVAGDGGSSGSLLTKLTSTQVRGLHRANKCQRFQLNLALTYDTRTRVILV